ncbi:methyltransferase domain-containing protein [Streptomyces hiroshimensis]|uniref:Protein-L-isoaspartate O-methyltransferase n=1 Tax=Streptomyces hiroshimensis TaxID=66424 RepID=A0ABQ2YUC7_9ACTN|nr:methyltransferase domain-containing protein [Streptomyces hiroshimensis]GGX93437.1 protein-L-isoaspartate O-methyltransferase [Streptomyces hiroshimensis]
MSAQEQAIEEAGPRRLASALMESGALTPDWLPAFEAVRRDGFVPDRLWPGRASGTVQGDCIDRSADPDAWWDSVYSDIPLTTQWDDGSHTGTGKGRSPTSSNSMPKMVFSMLGALSVEPGNEVLEVGTGTGWNAALLAHRLGPENVVTVEVDRAGADEARRRFGAFGLTPLSVVGDGAQGYEPRAPYDRIIATCSIAEVPYAWVGQSRPGAVIVAPWGPAYGGQGIVRLSVAEDGRTASGPFVMSSAFMRLRGQRETFPPRAAYPGSDRPASGCRRVSPLSPDDMGDWIHMFTIGVCAPGLFCRVEKRDGGAYRLWLFDMAVTSWATADYEKGRTEFDVAESGPRRLWAEVEQVMDWWYANGRPGFGRYGLTVTPEGQSVWLDAPENVVPTVRSSLA